MKTNFKLLLFFVGTFSILFLASCNKEIETNAAQDVYSATYDEALKVAQKRIFDDQINFKESNEVTSSRKVADINGITAYYILNFEKGFSIISGDKRVAPVLAYSTENSFPLDVDSYNIGLENWLRSTKKGIEAIRDLNEGQSLFAKKQWERYLSENSDLNLKKEPLPDPCEDEMERQGPLLETLWGQRYKFNDYIVNLGCTNDVYGNPPAGCVAIAMGQIMKYHEYPSGYAWTSMTLGLSGDVYSGELMDDIGDTIGMNYTCAKSTVGESLIAPCLINDYSYTSATRVSASNLSTFLEEIKPNLRNGNPVIFVGEGENDNGEYEAHAWVCDGFQTNFFCETLNSSIIYHMNWGMHGDYNGWYGFRDWSFGIHNLGLVSVIMDINP